MTFSRKKMGKTFCAAELDDLAAEYLNCMYQEGESVSAGGHLLSGIKRFMPDLRQVMPKASQYFKNWQKVHQPQRAIPVSWALLQAIAAVFWSQGSESTALMLYLGFQCFLRTAEMLALQYCHLLPHATKPEVAVVIPFAKTSHGNPQVLVVYGNHVWSLCCHLKNLNPSTQHLWRGQFADFHRSWKTAIECLGFAPEDYSPYGIRRGGATWHFLRHKSMDLTLARGRWSHSKTARLYVDDGTLTLAQSKWKASQKRGVKAWLKTSRDLFKRLRSVKKQRATTSVCTLRVFLGVV